MGDLEYILKGLSFAAYAIPKHLFGKSLNGFVINASACSLGDILSFIKWKDYTTLTHLPL